MDKTMNNTYPADIAALLADMQMGKYKNLQIFLYRNPDKLGLGLGQQYLAVNHESFELLRLISLDYRSGIIQLVLINEFTDEPFEIYLDVNDEHPDTHFVCWQDIKNLVSYESAGYNSGKKLPDLDTEEKVINLSE